MTFGIGNPSIKKYFTNTFVCQKYSKAFDILAGDFCFSSQLSSLKQNHRLKKLYTHSRSIVHSAIAVPAFPPLAFSTAISSKYQNPNKNIYTKLNLLSLKQKIFTHGIRYRLEILNIVHSKKDE